MFSTGERIAFGSEVQCTSGEAYLWSAPKCAAQSRKPIVKVIVDLSHFSRHGLAYFEARDSIFWHNIRSHISILVYIRPRLLILLPFLISSYLFISNNIIIYHHIILYYFFICLFLCLIVSLFLTFLSFFILSFLLRSYKARQPVWGICLVFRHFHLYLNLHLLIHAHLVRF